MHLDGRAILVAGGTASGKSALALALAERIGGEIVNADAFQLYRGLEICTAKPGPEDLARVPHHLYSVLDWQDTCDAQRYRELAEPVILSIAARGRWPIIVGGSGLYLKALTHGLAPVPKGDAATREAMARLTPEQRVAELLRLDPQAADNVPLENDRYVSRALEICLLTGQPQSALRQQWAGEAPVFMGVLLQRGREDLYQRINARVLTMMERGLVEEIRAMGELSLTAEKAIGVREVRSLLRGECTPAEAVAAIQQSTRRYAKRQTTWFKRERGFQTICLDPESTASSGVERILELFPCVQSPPSQSVPSLSI